MLLNHYWCNMNIQLTPQDIHDTKDFIQFFEEIPEKEWCTGQVTKFVDNGKPQHCAYGHLYFRYPSKSNLNELRRLEYIFKKFSKSTYSSTAEINDKGFELGNHPKERILNALKLLLKE